MNPDTSAAHTVPEVPPQEPKALPAERPAARVTPPSPVLFDELSYEDDAETLPNRELVDLAPILEGR